MLNWCRQPHLSVHLNTMSRFRVLNTSKIDKSLTGVFALLFTVIIYLFMGFSSSKGIAFPIWISIILLLIPTEGVIAMIYGFWSEKRLLAFLIGFLPRMIAYSVAASSFSSLSPFPSYVFLSPFANGLIGFGCSHFC